MKTTVLAFLLLAFSATAATADVVVFGSGGNQFTMEFAPIGNPGNAADAPAVRIRQVRWPTTTAWANSKSPSR